MRSLSRSHADRRGVRSRIDRRRIPGELERIDPGRSFRSHSQNHAAKRAWPSDAPAERRRSGFYAEQQQIPGRQDGALPAIRDAQGDSLRNQEAQREELMDWAPKIS